MSPSNHANHGPFSPEDEEPIVNDTPNLRHSWRSFLLESAPTILVLGLLLGLGYVGHLTGWSAPKFVELFGSQQAPKDDWCPEHSVPESICVECDDTQLSRLKSTWCVKHGVHNCPFERPDVVQLATPPTVTKADLDRAQRALDLKERKENSKNCVMHHRRIQFASKEVMDKMGVKVERVAAEHSIVETVTASGEIEFEQPRVAPASAPVAGRVYYVTEKGQLGAAVKQGDVLALLDAVEVGKAKAEILQAYAQLELRKKSVDLLKPLAAQGAVPQSKLLEADLALREAKIRLLGAQQALANMGLPVRIDDGETATTEELARRLHFLGLPADISGRLDTHATANLLPVIAARDGIVTATKASLGEMIDPGRPLFVVADTSRMWLMLNVRQEDVDYLRIRDPKTGLPGQTVKFRPDGKKKEIVGELVWKSSEVDDKTRSVQFRAELPNSDGALLAHTYGTGQIVLREEKNAITVPNEAIHWEGDCHIVFVRDKSFFESDGKKVFHVRTVRPGVTNAGYTEIIAGVLPGEIVAKENSGALRSELLKNNLGAG